MHIFILIDSLPGFYAQLLSQKVFPAVIYISAFSSIIQCLYQIQNGLRKHGHASEREALDPVRGISDAFDHAWRTLSSGCSGLSDGSLAGGARLPISSSESEGLVQNLAKNHSLTHIRESCHFMSNRFFISLPKLCD